jgi:transposase
MGIVEILNQRLGIDPSEKVSTGVIVKAMILNGLGFVSAPLYSFGQFFQGKATEQLLGQGIKLEHLNDDRLGNVLDELYTTGLSELFLGISLAAANKFEIKRETAHLDSTSFDVDGAYQNPEPGVIEITYGYSRDHRPDLKQFMMNLICVGDGDIPVFMEIASGNQSDKVRFAGLFQEFRQQWTFDGLCVADGALYSADNLTAMTKTMKWHQLSALDIVEKPHHDKAGKPRQDAVPTPTLRWVFQCFMAVHLGVFQGVQQIVNLTDERKHILRFFCDACRRYYLLPTPDS